MAVLGNASSVVRMVGQGVTFHDRDRVVELRKHSRREEARDSRAQHHRMLRPTVVMRPPSLEWHPSTNRTPKLRKIRLN